MRILKVPGSPLTNRQLYYLDLTVLDRDQQEFSYTFRQRGGCCRFHQVDSGEYCPTCVLKTLPNETKNCVSPCANTSAWLDRKFL